jgi:SAM-dependent methyltransferase
METILSHQEARRAYDRIGSLQDSQAFYEDRATNAMLEHGGFASADAVFEFGCGTGRFASRLLAEVLPAGARYRGVDVSPHMVSLARARVAPYSSRAEVVLTEGGPPADEPSESCDRFVSSYVFDLLSEDDIRAVLREAHRMLRSGGLLCLTGLSTGVGPLSRAVARAWSGLQARRPAWVGGCRPIDVLPLLDAASWQVQHHAKIVAFGVTSEVLIGKRG